MSTEAGHLRIWVAWYDCPRRRLLCNPRSSGLNFHAESTGNDSLIHILEKKLRITHRNVSKNLKKSPRFEKGSNRKRANDLNSYRSRWPVSNCRDEHVFKKAAGRFDSVLEEHKQYQGGLSNGSGTGHRSVRKSLKKKELRFCVIGHILHFPGRQ